MKLQQRQTHKERLYRKSSDSDSVGKRHCSVSVLRSVLKRVKVVHSSCTYPPTAGNGLIDQCKSELLVQENFLLFLINVNFHKVGKRWVLSATLKS